MTKTDIFFTFKEHKLTFDEFLNLKEKELDQVLRNFYVENSQWLYFNSGISQSFSWFSVDDRERALSKNYDAALLFKPLNKSFHSPKALSIIFFVRWELLK